MIGAVRAAGADEGTRGLSVPWSPRGGKGAAPLGRNPLIRLALRPGLEPGTCRLTVACPAFSFVAVAFDYTGAAYEASFGNELASMAAPEAVSRVSTMVRNASSLMPT